MKPLDITPELIVQLYKKHKMAVKAFNLLPSNQGCCGMGIVALEQSLDGSNDLQALDGLTNLYGREFVNGFIAGFDLRCPTGTRKIHYDLKDTLEIEAGNSGEYLEAVKVGWRCADAALKAQGAT